MICHELISFEWNIFTFIHFRWDGQNTDPEELSVRENYLTIQWTKLRAEKLRRFYDSAPVEMQCSSGAGTQLPGKWTGMAQPVIRQTLPPIPRPACKLDLEGSSRDRELDDDQDRFRKRYWSSEKRRKRTVVDMKRSELRKRWIGRKFEVEKKKKRRAESFMSEAQPDEEEEVWFVLQMLQILTEFLSCYIWGTEI